MAATKAQLMTDIRENLATAGRAFDHFVAGASDLDAVCAGLIEFLTNEIVAGGAPLTDGDKGDITVSAAGVTWTIDAGVVTLAKMANIATATFVARNTAGTGVPEAVTTTQATALLNAATSTLKGMVPTPPNNTTTFLRGDATFSVPKQRFFLFYGGAVMTAGDLDRFPNPVGFSTSPIGATGNGYHAPVTGSLIATHYRVITAHTTNTITVIPRVNGVQQTVQTQTIAATVTNQSTTHATPLAVTAGEFISCQMDHNGATNLAGLTIIFEIEY